MNGARILVVEDERELRLMLQQVLTEEGYEPQTAPDGQRGLHLGLTHDFDALVIDRGLPAIEGVDLLRRLRARGVTAPALLLTARASIADRVEGLDAGAEDYLVKPFDLDELLARLRALLRRGSNDDSEIVRAGTLRLLISQRIAAVGDEQVPLSEREFALLEVLARRPSRVFTREELLELFEDASTIGSVDTYVHYVRRKLGRSIITTVRGTGYCLGSV